MGCYDCDKTYPVTRSGRRKNAAIESVLEESKKNLLAAFEKSTKTKHSGIKGEGRSKYVLNFLQNRLPRTYGFAHKCEAVDYRDSRSGEIDIAIYDRLRNAILSDDPVWVPAEALLAVIEVKSELSQDELRKAYAASLKIGALRPFKREFTLNLSHSEDLEKSALDPLRCFRTVFA